MAKLLRYEGFNATCAANGVEALDVLSRARVDLILLDVMMPKMNGLDFLQSLRGNLSLRHIPVIALTATLDPNQLTRLHELGVVEVMPKARFTIEQLLERVRFHSPGGGT
jgi:CheY-like chemotaxis protein